MQLNTRVVNHVSMQRVESSLKEITNRFERDEYRVAVNGMFTSPPKAVTEAIAALQRHVESAGKLAGRSITWADTGGACDGSKLAAFGLPNIDTMGISGGNLHSPGEFCGMESLVPAAHTVAAFINAFG